MSRLSTKQRRARLRRRMACLAARWSKFMVTKFYAFNATTGTWGEWK